MKIYTSSNEPELKNNSSARAYMSVKQQSTRISKELDDLLYQISSYKRAGLMNTNTEDFLVGNRQSIKGQDHILDLLDIAVEALRTLARVCDEATDFADEADRWFPRKS